MEGASWSFHTSHIFVFLMLMFDSVNFYYILNYSSTLHLDMSLNKNKYETTTFNIPMEIPI